MQAVAAASAGWPASPPGARAANGCGLSSSRHGSAIVSVLPAGFTLGALLGHSEQVGLEQQGSVIDTTWVWIRRPFSAAINLCLLMVLIAQETPRLVGVVVPDFFVTPATRVSPALGSLGGGLILLFWLLQMALSLLLGARSTRFAA